MKGSIEDLSGVWVDVHMPDYAIIVIDTRARREDMIIIIYPDGEIADRGIACLVNYTRLR